MRILLSIKPEFAEKILKGEKRYEFRRAIHSNRSVDIVVIYMTAPIQKIVGEFRIDSILSDSPDKIWDKTHQFAGISRENYDIYFKSRKLAYALSIGSVTKYPIPIDPKLTMPSFTPPQSFMYCPLELSNQTVKNELQIEMAY
ncbi:ASCH domain-containing protein [Methylobacterium sp. J-078]|uniref:ASCH domain-containing protein n=1 Tax=Methylobacterium sp. J-078 TaxID=2836657 RepID=UPI003918A6B5